MAGEIQLAHVTGKNVYALVRNATGSIWNGSAFVAYATANLSTYALTLTEQGTASAYYAGTFPAVAAGVYNLVAYERAGGSPAEGDPLIATGEMHWDGAAVQPRLTRTQVNDEVVDVIRTDALAELSAVPAAGPSLDKALMFLYMALRNQLTVTSTQQKVRNDAGTVIGTSALADDAATFTRGKFA